MLSVPFAGFAAWAAIMQLNDPDPERWFALYAAAAVVSAACAIGRPLRRATLAVALIAFVWAAAIIPALIGHWSISDLGATMTNARPEIELGRELGGLLIVGSYCALAAVITRATRSPKTSAGKADGMNEPPLPDPPRAA